MQIIIDSKGLRADKSNFLKLKPKFTKKGKTNEKTRRYQSYELQTKR